MFNLLKNTLTKPEIDERISWYDDAALPWLESILSDGIKQEYDRGKLLDHKASWSIATGLSIAGLAITREPAAGAWPLVADGLSFAAVALAATAVGYGFAAYRGAKGWPTWTDTALFPKPERGRHNTPADPRFRILMLHSFGVAVTRQCDAKVAHLRSGQWLLGAAAALLAFSLILKFIAAHP